MDMSIGSVYWCSAYYSMLFDWMEPAFAVVSIVLLIVVPVQVLLLLARGFHNWLFLGPIGVMEGSEYVFREMEREGKGTLFHTWNGLQLFLPGGVKVEVGYWSIVILRICVKGNFAEGARIRQTAMPWFRVQIREGELRASRVLRPGMMTESSLMTAVQCAVSIAGYYESRFMAARAVSPPERCGYCRESLDGETFACPDCDTLHHEECFELNHGCSVFGCRRLPPLVPCPSA